MSDWNYLNEHRVRKPVPPGIPAMYASDDSYGFNGMFRIPTQISVNGILRCIASDGSGSDDPAMKWQHVSVSIEGDPRPPKWSVMCAIKDLFWEPQDWVVQFHPAHSEYVSFASGCLHLWKPLPPLPPITTPPAILVGPGRKYERRN